MLTLSQKAKAESRRRRFGLALLSGVFLGLSFPRSGLWPLAWVGLVFLLMALRGQGAWRGFWLGWLCGTATTMIGLSWIGVLLTDHASQPWPVAAVVLLIGAVTHGAPLSVAGLVTGWIWQSGYRPTIALPIGIVTGELLVPLVFPWLLAISQHEILPLIQISDIFGARGVSAIIALGSAAIYELIAAPYCPRARRSVLIASMVVGLILMYGCLKFFVVQRQREQAEALELGIVQANLTIEDKHDRAKRAINLALHQDMTLELERRGAEIVLWPESAYPYPLSRDQTTDRPGHRAIRKLFSIPIIFGAITIDETLHRRFNSVYLLDREHRLVGPVDKNELLLFGEYLPLYDNSQWLQRRFPHVWNFTPGTEPGVLRNGSLRAGVLNCYEDALPHFVRTLAQKRPNLFVNLTNDAWFGDTAQPYQHAASARFRAIEHRVDLVRAVNSGVSTVVTSSGVQILTTDGGRRDTPLTEVRLTDAGTVYTVIGDSWAWCFVGLGAILLLVRRWLRYGES